MKINKPLKEDWKIEFDKFRNFDGCEYGHDFHHRIKKFIEKIEAQSKSQIVEQILGIKSMKKESYDNPDTCRIDEKIYYDSRNKLRNQLRLEIKEEIRKL